MPYYYLYGLTIKSNKIIHELISIDELPTVDIDLCFHLNNSPIQYKFQKEAKELFRSGGLSASNIPYFTIWKQFDSKEEYLICRYSNGKDCAFFVIEEGGKTVHVYYSAFISLTDLSTYFSGPVIGCILKLKEKFCLHASVVNINEKAVLFIGEKQAGKSTLIATFASLGYPILSDDIAVIYSKKGQYFVHVGYPRLRLWEETIGIFKDIDEKKLTPVLSFVNKYYLPLTIRQGANKWMFQTKSLPISNIYHLHERNEENILKVSNLNRQNVFFKLSQNRYAPYMIESRLIQREFIDLTKMAEVIPVKLLDRPNNLHRLHEICKVIEADTTIA